MFFEKILKKVTEVTKTENGGSNNNRVEAGGAIPKASYVHTKNNIPSVIDEDYNCLVLYWVKKKKKGYDLSTNKYPKWFANTYGIDFNKVANGYIASGELNAEGDIVSISPEGLETLKMYAHVIYVYEHPQYELSLDDYRNATNLGKVQNSDIAWGIFNQRILSYIEKRMWNSLASNYAHMADLLVEEKKYEQALDFVFAAAYIETSGMLDNNELTPIMSEYTANGWKKQFLSSGLPDIFLLEINNYWVTVPFLKIHEELRLNWDDVRERYIKSDLVLSMEANLPFKYFEKEESFEIFKAAIQNGGGKGVFQLKDMTKNLKYNIPNENSRDYFYASVENKVNRQFGR